MKTHTHIPAFYWHVVGQITWPDCFNLLQKQYNNKFNITPTPINKSINDVFAKEENQINSKKDSNIEEEIKNLSKNEKEKEIRKYRSKMEKAAKSLDFLEAARLRDIIKLLKV